MSPICHAGAPMPERKKKKDSEKEISEEDASLEQMLDYLETVFEATKPLDIDHTIKTVAKILYQFIIDLDKLKIELLKVFKDECEEVNHKKEEEDGRFYT